MNSHLRRELNELYALDDALRQDFARFQRKLEEKKVELSRPQDVIYKTYEPPADPARATLRIMTAQEQASWDAWLRAHFEKELNAFAAMLGEEVARAENQLAAKLRKEFERPS